MPADPVWIRAESLSSDTPAISKNSIDRENKILRGYVVAQLGPLKSGRGEFDELSLNQMADVINSKPHGLKSRFTHPSLSDDGLGKFLGRAKNGRVEDAQVTDHFTNETKSTKVLRADLHFDRTAFSEPPKGGRPLGDYIMDLADSDPEALSSSVVIPYDGLQEQYRINEDGTAKIDETGREMPPLWRISQLHASDIVDTGDAVNGLLSADDLPDDAVRKGCELLDSVFGGQSLDVTVSRSLGWLRKYIQLRHGQDASLPGDDSAELQTKIKDLETEKAHLLGVCAELQGKLDAARDENIRAEVEKIFDQDLGSKVKSGERVRYIRIATRLRREGSGPESEFQIFIDSLKAREGKNIGIDPIAEDAPGPGIVPRIPGGNLEDKRETEITGFLMP